jgi:hypothetical protein
MFDLYPPFAVKEYAWTFEVRLIWFKFWYVREKKKRR